MSPSNGAIFGIALAAVIVLFPIVFFIGHTMTGRREEEAMERYMAVVVANEGTIRAAEPANTSTSNHTHGEASVPGPHSSTRGGRHVNQ